MVLTALVGIALALGIAEWVLNGFFVFHWHQYACSVACDLLRTLAVSLAIVVTGEDLFRRGPCLLRCMQVWLIFMGIGAVAVGIRAWPGLSPGHYAAIYCVLVTCLLVGHAVVRGTIRRLVRSDRFLGWHAAVCLVIGLAPILVLAGIGWGLTGSVQLQSTIESFRVWVVLATAFCVPYAVLGVFLLPGLRSPGYRARLESL